MKNLLKRKMVPGWQKAWQWASVNCMAIALALQGAWLGIPEDLRASFPPHMASLATTGLLIFGLFGRLTTPKVNK